MAVTRVGGDAVASTTSVTSVNLTLPAGLLTNDVAILTTAYNPTTADSTLPAGWAILDTQDFNATYRARIYTKDLTAADSSTTVAISNALGQRLGGSVEIYRGSSGVDITYGLIQAGATGTTTHACATGTSATSGVSIVAFTERSGTASSSVTAPSGYTLRNSAFSVGNGACSSAMADKLATVAAGSTIGGGNWITNAANLPVITWAVSLTEAAATTPVGKEVGLLYDVNVLAAVGKSLTIRHNVSVSTALAVRVGGDSFATPTSTPTFNLTMPAGIQTGDVAWLMHACNPSTADSVVPAGWTLEDTQSQSATNRAQLYSKTLTPADSGTTVTITNALSQRLSGLVEVYRGVGTRDAIVARIETTASATHVGPSGTSTSDGMSIVFLAERSSSPSTTAATPSGYTLRNSAFGVGNGACSSAAGDRLTFLPSGTAIGGGNWVTDAANTTVTMWVVSLVELAPTTAVGKDLTVRHNVTQLAQAGKSVTIRHNVLVSTLFATRVGGATVAATTSVVGVNLVLPAGLQTGDVAWLVHAYNPTTADSVLPVGWSTEDTQDFSATLRARLYSKALTGADSGTTVAITNALSQRLGATVEVYRGVVGRNALAARLETAATAAHTGPSGVAVQDGMSFVAYAERSSSPSASLTAPVGYTLRDSSFGLGNGAISTGMADRLTVLPVGSTFGGGTWTADVANTAVVLWAVALTETPPLATAGKDLTIRHNVAQSTSVGKDLTIRHNVQTTAVAVPRVGGSATAPLTSVPSVSLTLPAGVQTGDVAWMMHVYNPTTADSVAPPEWAIEDTQSFSASMRVRVYSRTLDVADASTVVTITNALAQRMSAVVEVYRNVTVKNASGAFLETTSRTAHPGATAASAASGMSLVFMAERSSSPSTTVTAPVGYVLRDSAFGTGNGATGVAAADRLTVVTSGSTIGGGTWTTDVANLPVVTWVVSLTNVVTAAPVGQDLSFSYHDRNKVGDGWTGDISDLLDDTSRIFVWNVFTGLTVSAVGRTLSFPYNTASAVFDEMSLRWQTGGRVSSQRAFIWNSRSSTATAIDELTLPYAVRRIVAKSLNTPFNVEGPGAVGANLSISWKTDSNIIVDPGDPGTGGGDTDMPPDPIGDGDHAPPAPADQGLEYTTPQPIDLTLLQELLEMSTHVVHLLPETPPGSGDIPIDVVPDVPLTQSGIERVWTEITPGVSEPVAVAPVPVGPAEPSTNPEI